MNPSSQKTDKLRLNLLVSPRVKEQLDELQRKSDATSMTEVLRRSLALYDFTLDRVAAGYELVLKHPNQPERLIKLI